MLPFAQREVVSSREDQLFREWGRRVTLRDIFSKKETVLQDFSRLIDLKDVQFLLRREARRVLQRVGEPQRSVLLAIAVKLIEPERYLQ